MIRLKSRKDSAPVNAVINSSSVTFAFPNMAIIVLFVAVIIVSNTPPKGGVYGGLNVHYTPKLSLTVVALSCFPQTSFHYRVTALWASLVD